MSQCMLATSSCMTRHVIHCVGLADPIEMGALAAVLLASSSSPSSRQQPLTLTAAKAMMGHSEPAAGLVGLLTLATELSLSAAPGLLHLTSLNPYVGSVLNAAKAGTGSGSMSHGLVSMSRQTCGGPAGSGRAVRGGVSSFAFQGTNAHAVLSAMPGQPADPTHTEGGVTALMHKQRHWVLPKPHSLLTAAQTEHGVVMMQCQLSDPRLAFLLDHQVMGRALFPAAGMLEVAVAAARVMLADQSLDPLWACTISDLAITAPLQLTNTPSGKLNSAVVLQTSINAATGSLQISSATPGSPHVMINAKCSVGLASRSQIAVEPSAAEAEGALMQLVAGLDLAVEGDGGTGRRRARPGAGTAAGAGAQAAATAASDAIGQVSHFVNP